MSKYTPEFISKLGLSPRQIHALTQALESHDLEQVDSALLKDGEPSLEKRCFASHIKLCIMNASRELSRQEVTECKRINLFVEVLSNLYSAMHLRVQPKQVDFFNPTLANQQFQLDDHVLQGINFTKRLAPPELMTLCNPFEHEGKHNLWDKHFKISVITATYSISPQYLIELYYTLANQTYGNWEWVICDDASADSSLIRCLYNLSSIDNRIRLFLSPEPLGISGASNICIKHATGDYLAFVDHDDLLPRHIFEAAWNKWRSDFSLDLIYTDEAKMDTGYRVYDKYLKPDWSPTLLHCTMYVGHLSIIKTSLVVQAGGLRPSLDGTQDYDLTLRLSLAIRNVSHIQEIGYLWRAIPGSTARSITEKTNVIQKQLLAVASFASHLSKSASVKPGKLAGNWIINYNAYNKYPKLSFIIPTAAGTRLIRGENKDLLINCVSSMISTEFYRNSEIVIVHNGNLQDHHFAFLRSCGQDYILVEYTSDSFNLSEKINLGVSHASGEYVCLLNDDVEAITPRGGEALVSILGANTKVGAVGPKCLYEDNTIQHNGVVLLEQGPSHYAIGREDEDPGYFGLNYNRREVFAVTGALLILRKSHYNSLGGFDLRLPLNYNDVLFCSRVRGSLGLTCVVDPNTTVYHYESSSKSHTYKSEKEMLYLLMAEPYDPYFNSNFDQRSPWNDLAKDRDATTLTDPVSFENWLCNKIGQGRSLHLSQKTPKLSFGVSVYNQPSRLLDELFVSLTGQTYENFEVVLLDNGSSNPDTLTWLEELRPSKKVVFLRNEANQGIMRGQKDLLDASTGDYFLPVDADDFITVDAAEVFASYATEHSEVDVFYSDEFKADISSNIFSPMRKGSFDPIRILNCCYTCHLMMFRTSFLREIEAYTEVAATWCHDWDTTLQALERKKVPMYIPELTYAWRINPGSTASLDTGAKPEAEASQRFVLERYLNNMGLEKDLFIESNTLGRSYNGMWSVYATSAVENIQTVSVNSVLNDYPIPLVDRLGEILRSDSSCEWIAFLLDGTDKDYALRALSVPIFLDNSVGCVGSYLVDRSYKLVWGPGCVDRLVPYCPANGSDPRDGGDHGILYCQQYTDLVAGANFIVAKSILARALMRGAPPLSLGDLMIALQDEMHVLGRNTAVTPHVVAVLERSFASVIPR